MKLAHSPLKNPLKLVRVSIAGLATDLVKDGHASDRGRVRLSGRLDPAGEEVARGVIGLVELRGRVVGQLIVADYYTVDLRDEMGRGAPSRCPSQADRSEKSAPSRHGAGR